MLRIRERNVFIYCERFPLCPLAILPLLLYYLRFGNWVSHYSKFGGSGSQSANQP